MPREELIISTFDKGMQSGADQSDIEKGAAAWTQDIDSDSVPGTLRPRKNDSTFLDTNNNYCINRKAWITRADGKRDLILFDAKGNTINAITDFNGTPAYGSTLGTPTGTSVTMDTINRAVRVGQGDYAGKYVGYIDYGQFGGAVSTDLQYVDSELSIPTAFPTPYKIISDTSDTTYVYGIEWKGKKILKITSATGAYTESTSDFVSLQGICNIDTSYFYVYESLGQFGDLHKITKSDLSINATYHITGWGSANAYANQTGGTYMSDIELTTSNIWFGFWNETQFALKDDTDDPAGGRIIFKFALASLVANSNHATTDVTFKSVGLGSDSYTRKDIELSSTTEETSPGYISSTAIEVGSFYADPTYCTYWVKPSRRCFVRTETATEIGWLGNVGLLNKTVYEIDGATTSYVSVLEYARFGGRGIIFMNESSAKGDLLNSTNTRFRSLGVVTTYTEDTTATYYTDGIRAVGSGGTFYLFAGENLAPINAYASASAGDNEFTIEDAVWLAATDNPDDVYWAGNTYSKSEEKVWNMYTNIESGAATKASIGIMSSVTLSVKSVSTADVNIWCMSSASGTGKFNSLTFSTSTANFSGSLTYIKVSPTWFHPSETTDDIGVFDTTKSYFYKLAFEYDNYQYSPLSQAEPARVNELSSSTNTISIKIELYATSTYISKRVTGLLILRAEAAGTKSFTPTSNYRIAGRISLVDAWAEDSTESATWGTKKQISFTDTGLYGSSYENETGCPETLPNNTMDYTISCTGAGYLFVGQGYNDELNEISNFVFRSKRNAPDTFDWSNDFCILPTMPIALYFFKGYLYAFDSNKMYVIDPEALVLIGEYEGFGVQSALAICSNEDAMFFANTNNICMHDGKQPIIVSEAINQVGTSVVTATSHRMLATGRTIVTGISSYCNSLIVAYMHYGQSSGLLQIGRSYIIVSNSGGIFTNVGAANSNAGTSFVCTGTTPTGWGTSVLMDFYTPMFVYNFIKQGWFYWELTNVTGTYLDYDTVDKRSLIIDYLGIPYISVKGGIIKLLGSTTEKTAYWWSKLINFGNDSVIKKIYRIYYDGTTSIPCYIDYNNAQTFATAVTSGTQLTNAATQYRTIQLRFGFNSTYLILRGITIFWRKMLGLR
jgi:hypothetical protein